MHVRLVRVRVTEKPKGFIINVFRDFAGHHRARGARRIVNVQSETHARRVQPAETFYRGPTTGKARKFKSAHARPGTRRSVPLLKSRFRLGCRRPEISGRVADVRNGITRVDIDFYVARAEDVFGRASRTLPSTSQINK